MKPPIKSSKTDHAKIHRRALARNPKLVDIHALAPSGGAPLKPGDKVRLKIKIPSHSRKHYKPVPKQGWVYLIDEIVTVTDEDGTDLCLFLKGIKNVKDCNGNRKVIPERYFDKIQYKQHNNQNR